MVCLTDCLPKKLTQEACRKSSKTERSDKRRNEVVMRRRRAEGTSGNNWSISKTEVCTMERERKFGTTSGCKNPLTAASYTILCVWKENSVRPGYRQAGLCRVGREKEIHCKQIVVFPAVRPWIVWQKERKRKTQRAKMELRELDLSCVFCEQKRSWEGVEM